MEISIIIPAYDVEKYIANMLEDVKNQTFDDFEVLIINDGSTDDTAKIAEDYCKQDKRFKLINKVNGGVSSARNKGLDIAKGKYVVFWDADDAVPKHSLEYLYGSITKEDADMAIGMQLLDGTMGKTRALSLKKLTRQKEISRMEAKLVWVFSACNKIFKRDIIEKNNLRFVSLDLGEDSIFWIQYLKYVKKIAGCPYDVYKYKKRLSFGGGEASLTQREQRYYKGYFDEYIKYLEDAFNDIFEDEVKNEETTYYREKLFQELYKRLCKTNIISEIYSNIWRLNREEEMILRDAFEKVWSKIYPLEKEDIKASEKALDLSVGLKTKEELLADPKITFVVTRKLKATKVLIECIYKQKFPEFELLIDDKNSLIDKNELKAYQNIRYIDGDDLAELKNNAVAMAKGTWIVFFEEDIFPWGDTIKKFIGEAKENENIISLFVKRIDNNVLQTIPLLNIAFVQNDKRIRKEIDNTFSNKVFRVKKLKDIDFKFSNDSRSDMIKLYDLVNITRRKSTVMMTDMTNEDYKKQIKHWKAKIKLKARAVVK